MMATFETGDTWLLKRNWFDQTAVTTGAIATTAIASTTDNNNDNHVQTIYLQYGYYIG